MIRRAIITAGLLAGLLAPLAAFAQGPPPPVPALPDSPRQTTYTISGTTCACAVGWQLYGDSNDYQNWVEVWLNGTRVNYNDATFGWTITSATGQLTTIPRPIIDGVLTFNQVQTGTVIIVGAQRPRRLIEFTESAGVPARAHNQTYNSITAMLRENWDKTNDLTGRGLFFAPGNTTGRMPQPSACVNLYLAFDATGLQPVCQAIIGTGSFIGVGQGLVNNSGTLSTSAGVPANILNGKTANYTIANTDCGATIQLGGNAFFTLSVPSVAGFDSKCTVDVANSDSWASGRAKILGGGGVPSSAPALLWPTQTITFKIVQGAWYVFNAPGRVKLPALTTITLNTDFTNGSDSNDGLGTGAGNALKTYENCLSTAANYFDFNTTTQPSKVICLGSSGNADTSGIHQALHAFIGCNGGACILIDGNGGSTTAGWQFYFGTVVQIRNITFSNSTGDGNCIEANWNAKVYVLDLVTYGACTSAHIAALNGASHVELANSYTVGGNAAEHIFATDGASVHADPSTTVTFSGAVSVTEWVEAVGPSYVNLQGQTFNTGGHVVTAQEALIQLNGAVVQSSATLAVTGAVSGTSSHCKLTVATASLFENQLVNVAAVGGATGCNTTAPTAVAIHIVDTTHLELLGTTFGGSYTSGGTVQIGLPGTSNASITLGGQIL